MNIPGGRSHLNTTSFTPSLIPSPLSLPSFFLALESGLVFLVDFFGTAVHKSCFQHVINHALSVISQPRNLWLNLSRLSNICGRIASLLEYCLVCFCSLRSFQRRTLGSSKKSLVFLESFA